MNYKNLNKVVKQIESMGKEDHIQLLSIFKNNNIEVTENINGCFIDLTNIDCCILEEVQKYIDYVEKKKTELNEVENQKEDLKKQIKEISTS